MDQIDWRAAVRDLDAYGCATFKGMLTEQDCCELVALYADKARFRA